MLKLFGRKSVDPAEGLQASVGEHKLPSFPAVIMSALREVRKPDVDLGKVADVVASDPGLSVHLMSTVNSAGYGLRHRVKSVHHASSLLGRNELESLLITSAVRGALPSENGPGFEAPRFWLAAARRASTARALAAKIDPSNCSECFTAALLQDMAMPILVRHNGSSYGEVLETWHQGEADLVGMERDRFGWDHAVVATWMSSQWKFPERLIEAIGAHHGVEPGEAPGLAAVNLAAVIPERDDESCTERLIETARIEHGLEPDTTIEILERSFSEAEQIARLFV